MRAELDRHRSAGLTSKNLAFLRKIRNEDTRARLMEVPSILIAKARAAEDRAPTKAAVEAQLAVAIQILLYAPMRIGNLVRIRIGENLIRPGGPGAPYRIVFPEHDVKNRVELDFPLTEATTRLIEDYLERHHAVLLHGRRDDFLFPGEKSGHKGETTFAGQIAKAIKKTIGLEMTPHQFRHAAADLILTLQVGNYEPARQVLGHKTIATTMRAYVGLETARATQAYGEMIEGRMKGRLLDGE